MGEAEGYVERQTRSVIGTKAQYTGLHLGLAKEKPPGALGRESSCLHAAFPPGLALIHPEALKVEFPNPQLLLGI